MSVRDYLITEDDIEAYGVRAAPDMLTGTARQNKEVFDRLPVRIAQQHVNPVIERFAELEDDTAEWTTDEQQRAANEAGRQEAETARVAAEQGRDTAEQAREAAEALRRAAELARAQAEQAREDAETARVSAEDIRAANESARQNAEQARAAAETARALAEGQRATAESARQAAESARAQQEVSRQTAEQGRADAENARASAEVLRVSAEQAREDAETGYVAQAAAAAASAKTEADRAKTEADRASQIVGGDFATKEEAQEYVSAHNAAEDAHAALFAGKAGIEAVQAVQGNLQTHMADAVKHVTAEERAAWNAKEPAIDILAVAKGGTGAGTASGARANLEIGKTVWGTAAFPAAGWTLTEDGTAYTQTVSLASAKAAMRFAPDIRLLPSDDADAAALEKEAFALLSDYGETGDGTLTLTTAGTDAPQVAFTVMLLGEVA